MGCRKIPPWVDDTVLRDGRKSGCEPGRPPLSFKPKHLAILNPNTLLVSEEKEEDEEEEEEEGEEK